MIETVALVVAVVVILSACTALYIWTRVSESTIDYDHPGLTDEKANALRLGIALTVNQNNIGP
jgi:hypothetical protein